MRYIPEAQSSAIVTHEMAFEAISEAFQAASAQGSVVFPALIAHGSDPSNRFSVKSGATEALAGLKMGFEDTRGTLFFHIARIINHHKPKIVFLENVKGLKSHDKGRTYQVIEDTLVQMGYNVHSKILNAKDFGVPQNRERIYIVGFLDNVDFAFPKPIAELKKVGDILEKDVPKKYTISR